MPLSSVLGAQSLVRPGVCTSSTRPASPFEGQVIYETDTNQTLVYSGSAWVMIADIDNPPALHLIANKSFTTSSEEIFTCFSSEFDDYKIMLYITATSATSVDICLQYGNSGTFSNTTYGNFNFYILSDSTSGNWGTSNFATSYNFATIAGGDKPPASSSIDLFGPFLSTETRYTSLSYGTYLGNVQRRVGIFSNGGHGQATSYSQLRVFPGSGTMTGRIRIYGYRNS